MTFIQTALIIPALALGSTFDSHQAASHTLAAASRFGERSLSIPKRPTENQKAAREAQVQTNFVLQRKSRIQNVLVKLDHIAQVTAQMKPETADRVEPVIVDLAEQAIELANEQSLQAPETDATLTRIETTVTELTRTMNRYVEPEASL